MTDIHIFRRDQTGMLIERLEAASARPVPGGWLLSDVTRHAVDPPRVTREAETIWTGQLDLNALSLLALPPRELSFGRIVNLVVNDAYGQRPTALYKTWINYRVASAFTGLLMILLVAALAQRFRRTGTFTRLFVLALIYGDVYYREIP